MRILARRGGGGVRAAQAQRLRRRPVPPHHTPQRRRLRVRVCPRPLFPPPQNITVCCNRDAKGMAKGVMASFAAIIKSKANVDDKQAMQIVSQMMKNKQLLMEV